MPPEEARMHFFRSSANRTMPLKVGQPESQKPEMPATVTAIPKQHLLDMLTRIPMVPTDMTILAAIPEKTVAQPLTITLLPTWSPRIILQTMGDQKPPMLVIKTST
tara:strand:+ start:234 stop:551 length:318 start_codon:yes stop_codon:yes gene_type:complete